MKDFMIRSLLFANVVIGIGCHGQIIPTPGPVGPPGTLTPALIQQNACNQPSGMGTSYTCTFGSGPSNAHVLIASAGSPYGGSSTVVNTPSSTGASWTNVALGNGTFQHVDVWCATLSGTPGSTITITVSTSNLASGVNISEWSNMTCSVDSSPAYAGGTNSTWTTGTVTTTNASDLLIAAVQHQQTGSITSGPSNSFTAMNTPNNFFNPAYLIVSSTGSYSTQWINSTSVQFDTAIVALKVL
jgi:hypothetical protein